MNLKEILEMRIREIGITKAELGRRLNTSRQNVNSVLAKNDRMDLRTLSKLCEVLRYNFYEHIDQPYKTEPSRPVDRNFFVMVEVTKDEFDRIRKDAP